MIKATVGQVMSRTLLTVSADTPFSQLTDKLRQAAVHHLLVTDNDKLTGIISDRDILRFEGQGNNVTDSLNASDIMTRNFVTVSEDAGVDTASIFLMENNFSALPVMTLEDDLAGIVTWRDLLTYYVYHK